MPGIGIITNPYSKLNKRNPERSQLLGYILGEHGRLAITKSLEDLNRVAVKFRDSNIEILAINGGDGTIARTLRAFIDAYGDKPFPKIALLRGGTMNVLAQNLGIRGKPEHILFRLLEAHSSEAQTTTQWLTTLKVEDNYGFLFADGVSYNFLEEYYKNKTGPFGAALLVLKVFFSTVLKGEFFRKLIRGQTIKISPDQMSPLVHETLMIMAATIERIPFGLKLFPEALKDPNKLQFFSVTSKPEELVSHLPAIVFKTNPGTSKGKISGSCEELAIQAESRYTYTLDGELFTAKSQEVVVKLGPKLEFLVI